MPYLKTDLLTNLDIDFKVKGLYVQVLHITPFDIGEINISEYT